MSWNSNFMTRHIPERTEEEQITDQFLLLFLINDADIGVGDTKLQKLTYLSEVEMYAQGEKGLNFNFIKMPFGPFSSELKEDAKQLVKSNIITDYSHKSTDFGKLILRNFQQLIDNNSEIICKIRQTNTANKNLERDNIVDVVHQMRNPLRPWQTIDDTKHGNYILKRMKTWEKKKAFKLTKSDIASLEIYFNFKTFNSLRHSLYDARTTPAINLRDVPKFV